MMINTFDRKSYVNYNGGVNWTTVISGVEVLYPDSRSESVIGIIEPHSRLYVKRGIDVKFRGVDGSQEEWECACVCLWKCVCL